MKSTRAASRESELRSRSIIGASSLQSSSSTASVRAKLPFALWWSGAQMDYAAARMPDLVTGDRFSPSALQDSPHAAARYTSPFLRRVQDSSSSTRAAAATATFLPRRFTRDR